MTQVKWSMNQHKPEVWTRGWIYGRLDEVVVLYIGRVIFRKYIPKKHKCFGIKIYTLWQHWTHMWYSILYGQNRTAHCTTPHCKSRNSIRTDMEKTRMWPKMIHGQLLFLPRPVRWLGHDSHLMLWHCQPQQDLGPKKMRLKQGDIQVRTGGELTAVLWRGKCYIHMLTNIHNAPAKGYFCNNHWKAIKPQIMADYYRHMGCVDKGNRMADSYSINHHTWKNSYFSIPHVEVRKFG